MSKPLFDRTQGTTNSYLGWTDNQLLRRPPPSQVAGDCGQYTWATLTDNTYQSTTTTVVTLSASSVEVYDVVPMNFGAVGFGFADDAFWTYDDANSAITILQPGIYDIILLAAFTDDTGADSTLLCNFNRYIEVRIGAKVTIADYTAAIPRVNDPWDGWWWETVQFAPFSLGSAWAPPDTGFYFTSGLSVNMRFVYDPVTFPDGYAGTSIQCFYSHDEPDVDQPSIDAVLQVIRHCPTPVPPTFT